MKIALGVGGGFNYPYIWTQQQIVLGEQYMELQLQFGHGMMGHCRELLDRWGGGQAILSPRDLTNDQLLKLSDELSDRNGTIWLDPQCYAKEADHHRLQDHAFWKIFKREQTNSFLGGGATSDLLVALFELNDSLNSSSVVLPGLTARSVREDWLVAQETVAAEARKIRDTAALTSTISLSAEAMLDEAQIEAVVEASKEWPVESYYVVPETPGPYLVDNPSWMANLLLLTAGLKLQDREVVVGYSSHQMLALAVCKVDAIASGTWLNVRAFPPEKFFNPNPDDISRRARWYYCPQALSEFKIPFLDIAKRMRVLPEMKPPSGFPLSDASPLFAGASPSSVDWGEQSAFRHYLDTLHHQVSDIAKDSFDETVQCYLKILDEAESLLVRLSGKGVLAGDRDFSACIDANRSAISVLRAERGAQLKRRWGNISLRR